MEVLGGEDRTWDGFEEYEGRKQKVSATEHISPIHNAVESLGRVAREIEESDTGDPLALKGAVAWGWHAVGLLAYLRLQPDRDRFDAWVQDYLHEGEPSLKVDRYAHWEERERLSFLEMLDLLSAPELPSLKADFYQGWQDRMTRCQGLRFQVAELVGQSLGTEQRDQLLLLLAAYHRLVRLPAGVSLETAAIWEAFPALLDLADLLLDPTLPEAREVTGAIERCRNALEA